MLKRGLEIHYASKLVWVLGQHFAHKIPLVHQPHLTPSFFVLATKQTLLSFNLVNHALLRLISDYQFIGPKGHTLDTPKEPRCLET